jgi:tetratricopeptide (TPR) repeat protein
LGSAYSSNGEDLKAAALYEKAIYEQGMKEFDLWTLLAKACRRAGDGERAVSALIACLRWRPSWVGRLKDQFELLATDPEVGPESIAALEAASLPEEARGAWQEILAHVYMVTGEGQKALDLVLTLDREKKGSGKFVFSLARLLSRRGDPGMALAALDSVLAFPPGPGIAEEVWYERGRLLETLGRVEEAVAAYGEGEQRYARMFVRFARMPCSASGNARFGRGTSPRRPGVLKSWSGQPYGRRRERGRPSSGPRCSSTTAISPMRKRPTMN